MKKVLFLLVFVLAAAMSFGQGLISLTTKAGETVSYNIADIKFVKSLSSGSLLVFSNRGKTQEVTQTITYIRDSTCNAFMLLTENGVQGLYSKNHVAQISRTNSGSKLTMKDGNSDVYVSESYATVLTQASIPIGCGDGGGGSGVSYYTDDNFATLEPPSPTPVVGSRATDRRKGADFQYNGANWSTQITLEDGQKVMSPYTSTGNTLIFDSDLYNKAVLSVSSAGAVTISNPTNLASQTFGESFVIQLEDIAGASHTVNWGSSFVTQDGTALSSVTLGANEQLTFVFKAEVRGGAIVLSSQDELTTARYIAALPAATSLTAAEKLVVGDSTITFQKLRDQLGDSTIFSAATYADISKISTPLKVGDRIKIKSNGNEYVVKQDSVKFYTTDQENVINLGGRFAVIDLSKKREFESKKELQKLVHFLSIKDKEKIKVGGVTYRVSFFPEKYYRSETTSAVQDIIVDGFFVDTLQIDTDNRNAVYYSEDLLNIGRTWPDGTYPVVSWLNGNAGRILQNAAIAPDGTLTAERIYGFNSTASNALQLAGDPTSWGVGDTVTISFWARGNKTTGTNERARAQSILNPTSVAGLSDINFVLDGEWHQYTRTAVTTSFTTTSKNIYFGIFDGFANADTLDIWGFDVHKGGPRPYQKSTRIKGYKSKIYLYREINIQNGELDLSFFRKSDYTSVSITPFVTSDAIFIQNALNYCASGERCNKVILPKANFRIDRTINIPRGVRLLGANPGNRSYGGNHPTENISTVFYVQMNNPTDYVFKVDFTAPAQLIDNSGISNIQLVCIDTTGGILYIREAANCLFENITANVSGVGVIDTALHFAVNVGSDAHYNIFKNCYIGGQKFGLIYDGGVHNLFQDCGFSGNVGMKINGGSFIGQIISVEGSNTGLLTTGGTTSIVGFYTESTAAAGGSTVKMEGGSVHISNSNLQTETDTDTLINLVSGKNFTLENSVIVNQGIMKMPTNLNLFESVDFSNVGSVFDLENTLKLTPKQRLFIAIKGNYPTFTDNQIYKESGPVSKNAFHYNIYPVQESPHLIDTIRLGRAYMLGGLENLIQYSDTIPTGSFAFYNTYANLVPGPTGINNADVIAATVATPSSFVGTKQGGPYITGEPYTISCYLKGLSGDNLNTMVTFRLGAGGETVKFKVRSNEWKRYEKTVFYDATDGSGALRIENVTPGDSLAIWGVQVNPGYHATPIISTGNVGVRDTLAKLSFRSLQLNGALVDISGSPGTAGQIPVSTVTGWNWSSTPSVLDGSYAKLGGNAGTVTIGSNDNSLNLESNNVNRLRFDATGRMFSGTLTDAIFTASDSIALESATGKFHMAGGFSRLLAGGNVVFQVNNSTQAVALNTASNSASSFTASVQGGGTYLQHNSTTGAEQTTIGSATAGSTLKLNGVVADSVETTMLFQKSDGTAGRFEYFAQVNATTTTTISSLTAWNTLITANTASGSYTVNIPIPSSTYVGKRIDFIVLGTGETVTVNTAAGVNEFWAAGVSQPSIQMVSGTTEQISLICFNNGGTFYWGLTSEK